MVRSRVTPCRGGEKERAERSRRTKDRGTKCVPVPGDTRRGPRRLVLESVSRCGVGVDEPRG